MYIDTHCHLNFKAFKKDLDEVVLKAKNMRVKKIIVPGAKINSSKRGVEIAEKYQGVYAAVGVHPHHVQNKIDFEELRILAGNKKTVAVGEIGLDHYHYKDYPEISSDEKTRQVAVFRDQLKLARDMKLPVIIHCRQAQNLILPTIREFIQKYGQLRGVFHCFDGTEEYLRNVLDMGFYIGFDGNITYPENINLSRLVKLVPADRLLLETDAPFLTPIPYRGTRNEPANIIKTAGFIAGLLKIGISELARMTCKNAETLFFRE